MIHIDIDIQDEQEADRVLSLLDRERVPHRVQKQPGISEEERVGARERIMRGAPTLNIDEMLKWLEESKKDRKLPFRDENE